MVKFPDELLSGPRSAQEVDYEFHCDAISLDDWLTDEHLGVNADSVPPFQIIYLTRDRIDTTDHHFRPNRLRWCRGSSQIRHHPEVQVIVRK